jgi:fructoselysine 6-phosphate deglycase
VEIKSLISEIKQKLQTSGGLKRVCFVGCGGSLAAIWPAFYMLQSEAKFFGVASYNSNEFVHAAPASCDEQSICIICSLNATPETVEAVKVAKKRGSITIAMTGSDDTLMAKTGRYVVLYSNGKNLVYSQGNQAQALRIGFEILKQFEGYEKYDAAMSAFPKIDGIIAEAKKNVEPTAVKFANDYKDEPVFYIMASGPLFSAAYGMSFCHLMEMQWKHAVPLHCGEYFHGPFETTDENLPIVLMMSVGRTRPLDERVLTFLKKHARKVTVLDLRDLGMDAIEPCVVEFFNSVVMVPIEKNVVSKMAEMRGHSMDKRRYMWKVQY